VCLVLISGCEQEAMELHQLVPQEANGWEAAVEGVLYDRDTLFDYIDGGAELYLAYGFREMLAARFERQGHPAIVADVFDMGSSEDAFGVFSAERQDPEAGIGQGSEYAAGLLRFWKGRFFVSIWAEDETAATTEAARELAAKIAEAVEPPGPPPQLLDLLPGEGLADTRLRYFHDHLSLNLYYFLAEENILGLSAQTEAVLAPYETAEGTTRLLLVRYPTAEEASRGLDGFLAAYLPEAGEARAARVESGTWVAAQSLGDVVMVAFDAPSRGRAEELLRAVQDRVKEQTR
jgi:hypothetical protein